MILFVGYKPSPRMKPGAKPFEGAACEKRLKSWIRCLTLGKCGYAIVNSNDYDRLSSYLDWAYEDGSPVVALGREAAKALKDQGVKCFILPHPSGRNRQLNDTVFIQAKLEECKKYIQQTKVLTQSSE